MPSLPAERHEAVAAISAIDRGPGRHWLAEQAAAGEPLGAKQIARLRAAFGAEPARWLVEFAAAQAKAAEKFGSGIWLSTQRGIQQATDRRTAAYKAARFPVGVGVCDLCCGIGGDAMALMARGPVAAVDQDAVLAPMAAANLREARHRPAAGGESPSRWAGAAVTVAAVQRWLPLPPGQLVHLDPDRRPGERRTVDPQHYQPPLATLERFVAEAAGAAVKLAPAATLPEAWNARCEREWISFRGSVRQQVAWWGALVADSEGPDPRGAGTWRATRLGPGELVDSFAVPPEVARRAAVGEAEVGKWLVDFDPAVRAAGLTAALAQTLGLRAVGGLAGFLTAATYERRHPLAAAYEIVWQGAAKWKRIAAAVRDRQLRIEAIKVRGAAVRPEPWQSSLAGLVAPDAAPATLLIGRHGKRLYAAIGRRG